MNKPTFTLLLFALLLLAGLPVQAQYEGLRSLFFNSAELVVRLDFSTVPPTPFNTGIAGAGAAEGIAHYEDCDGNLLFWFNSQGVFDQNGNQMPGSVGILADNSSAEVCITPIPGEQFRFYVIYNAQTCSRLYYSIVDMTLNGGLGNVVNLNTPITAPGENYAEGIEIIRKEQSNDYWMVAYNCGVGITRFLIDETGFGPPTNIHPLAMPPGGFDGRAELDFHKNRIAMACAWSSLVLTANFDAATGVLTNPLELNSLAFNNNPYGVNFSPDGSKMYITLWYSPSIPNLFQYDFASGILTPFTPAPITDYTGLGHIELGRDGKLYAIQDGGRYMIVVENPNSLLPTFSLLENPINPATGLPIRTGLGMSDFIKTDIFVENVFTGDTVCRAANEPVTLTMPDQSLTYEWFNDADPSTVIHSGFTYTFDLGTEPIWFTVLGTNVIGCVTTFNYTINPGASIDVTIDAGPNLTVELGESVQLEATSGLPGNYFWYPPNSLNDPTLLTPLASPTSTTTYFLSTQTGPCQATDLVTITVVDTTNTSDSTCVQLNAPATCSLPDTLLNITWVKQGTTTVLGTGAAFNVTPADPIEVYVGRGEYPTNALEGVYSHTCTLIATPEVNAGEDMTVDAGTTVTLDGTGGDVSGYTWTPAAGLSNPNSANPTFTATQTTTYTLTSSYDPYCPASDAVTIQVANLAVIDSMCAVVGQPLTLSIPNTFTSVRWVNLADTATVLSAQNNYTFNVPATTTVYEATGIDADGSIGIFVTTVKANPNISAGDDQTVMEATVVTLSATGGSNYVWSPGSFLNDSTSASPTTVPLMDDVTFSLTNTTDDGCITTDQVAINVFTESIILVPSGFSPNQDGINDVLRMTTLNVSELKTFIVYNRWGQEVFSTTNLTDGWDGTFNGKEQEVGVYVYFIQAINKDGEEMTVKGNSTLVR